MSGTLRARKKKTSQKPRRPGPAAKALEKFIADNGIKPGDAAEALRCTRPALLAWFRGNAVPVARLRKNIEAWTGGAIPETAWEKTDEVAPFHKGAA